MFPSLASLRIRRAALRFAGLLIAVCLGAACLDALFAPEAGAAAKHPAAEDAAPGQMPKVKHHDANDPCPENITPETWTRSSTLWRWMYRACKPDGAPAQYKISPEDMQFTLRWFITKAFSGVYDLPEYTLVFEELTPGICRVAVIFQTETFDVSAARAIAGRTVLYILEYYRDNGYSPAADSMLIAARVFARGDPQGTRDMYAIYDTETGLTNYGKTGYWQ